MSLKSELCIAPGVEVPAPLAPCRTGRVYRFADTPLPMLRGIQMRGGGGISKGAVRMFERMGIRADTKGPLEPWQQKLLEDYEAGRITDPSVSRHYEDRAHHIREDAADRKRYGGGGSPA